MRAMVDACCGVSVRMMALRTSLSESVEAKSVRESASESSRSISVASSSVTCITSAPPAPPPPLALRLPTEGGLMMSRNLACHVSATCW